MRWARPVRGSRWPVRDRGPCLQSSQEKNLPGVAASLDLAASRMRLLPLHAGTSLRPDALTVIIQDQACRAVAPSHTEPLQALASIKCFHAQVSTRLSAGGSTFLVDLAPRALHRCGGRRRVTAISCVEKAHLS